MWLLLWVGLAAGQGGFHSVSPPSKACENTTVFLDQNSTWQLPHGVFFRKQTCFYEFFYPEDTFLKMQFGLTGSFCTATIVDAFHVTMEYECLFLDNFSFPPPRVTILFHFDGFSPHIRDSKISSFFTRNFVPYNETEYLPITPGSEPLTIKPGNLKDHRTYVFDGMPSFSAYYLTRPETQFTFNSGLNSRLKAESLFLLDGNEGNFTVTETVLHWSGPQETTKMTLYNALFNSERVYDPMLLFIHTDDLAEYSKPRFKLESVEKQHVVLDAQEGMTSLTIPAFGRTLCNYYTLCNFEYSKDVEMILVNGFPKANISDSSIIQKYTASNLSKKLNLIVGCTKTLVVLNGSMSVTLWDRGDVELSDGAAGIIRTESEKDGAERIFADYDLDLWYEFEFKWSKDSSPNARMILHDVYDRERVYGPPNTIRFVSKRQRIKIAGLATVTYKITKTDPPSTTTTTTTRAPVNDYVPQMNSTYDSLPYCVRFRWMPCIYPHYG